MTDVLLSPIRLNELELLIENSVQRAVKNFNTTTQQHEADELLTVPDTAKFLSLSVATVYTLISKGELPVMKRSKRCYFSKVDLLNYLKEGRKKTVSEIEAETDSHFQTKRKKTTHN